MLLVGAVKPAAEASHRRELRSPGAAPSRRKQPPQPAAESRAPAHSVARPHGQYLGLAQQLGAADRRLDQGDRGVVESVRGELRPQCVGVAAMLQVRDARRDVAEPGALRFDVLRDRSAPNRFYLYEVYENEDAMAAHKATEHYRVWNETVAPWMAQPRSAVKTDSLFPEPWA